MGYKEKDITGLRHKMLVAIKRVETPTGITGHDKNYWLFRCDCGNTRVIRKQDIMRGNEFLPSCGCLPRKKNPLYGTKFYNTYFRMKSRCENKNNPKYKHYGARGIQCSWVSFDQFKEDMYESFLRHEKIHGGRQTTIDRIDVNRDYCKENCRWATIAEQNRNKRTSIKRLARQSRGKA